VRYAVRVLAEAEDDLLEIHRYVSAADSPVKAWSLLDRLEEACRSLSRFPDRGRIPPELRAAGVLLYREILLKPYRIVYRIERKLVHVYAVLDGRRDLTDILEERLLR